MATRSDKPGQAREASRTGRGNRRAGGSAGSPRVRASGNAVGSARTTRTRTGESGNGSRALTGRRQDSASRRAATATGSARKQRAQTESAPAGSSARRTDTAPRSSGQPADETRSYTSTRMGELRRAERARRLRASSRRYLMRIIIVVGVIVALLAGWAALYNSDAFHIRNVTVNGVEHLTGDEMSQLANVPTDTTLLRVDTDAIAERVKLSSWVQDVQVNRVFPDTLEINVTERAVAAIVEIPVGSGGAVKQWAIAEDHLWLMPIPEKGSEGAKTTSAKIYEDADNALHIVDVPYGTKAEIGQMCNDANVNNALDIVAGMTTELSDRIAKVSAAGTAETTLLLDNGVEVAFGKAEDIRDKERVILKILQDNPDGVAYINVRMVETPTWRAV